MKIPLTWLRELVEIDQPIPDLAHRLTMAGLEVEEIHHVGHDWRGITVARVLELEKHPRADNLTVVQLDLGDRQTTVVTAAKNLFVGAVIPHIAPGGRLPGGEIGTRSFQGITSQGMVCGGDELGLSSDKEGIYVLEDTATVGMPFADWLDETVLDIYITANRPDCMSMVGVAREVHALTGANLKPLTIELPKGPTPASELVTVSIEDPTGCPRFTATVVQGVEIKPSPLWLQRRLTFAGVRPISNVVDVTNYVMLELGQPLHAFDRTLLQGGGLVARRARPGETLVTLDGETRTLRPEMMVVADASGTARSLAGIMGGQDSEINDATRDIVLESAAWDRANIRISSSAVGLSSEASRRYGRGVDPELASQGLSRAVALTLQLAGGSSADGIVDVYPGREEPPTIRVRPEQIEGLLGTPYTRDQIVGSLTELGFGVQEQDDALEVSVPSHRRFDVEHRADLAEEVARVVGYDVVPATIISGAIPAPRPDGDAGYADELHARRTLAAAGLRETIGYALVDPALPVKLDAAASWPLRDVAPPSGLLSVQNPMSAEESVLRPTLLGSLLANLRSNLRNRERVLLYELGRTWRGTLNPLPDERRKIGIVMTGPRAAAHWQKTNEALDFYDLKGVVEALTAAFGLTASFEANAQPSLHPGRSATVSANGTVLGILGQLHPLVAERFDLEEHAVLIAELDFEDLLAVKGKLEKVHTPSRYPAAERDVAVVVDESATHAALQAAIRAAAGPLLRELRLFDVYRGEPIPEGKKSLAFSLTYQAVDRTLDDPEVNTAHDAVEQSLRAQFGAEIRGREADPG